MSGFLSQQHVFRFGIGSLKANGLELISISLWGAMGALVANHGATTMTFSKTAGGVALGLVAGVVVPLAVGMLTGHTQITRDK